METPPLYLLVYLLRIRSHSGEVGYLKRRFEHIGLARAVDEKAMLLELEDCHLCGFSRDQDLALFDDSYLVDRSGIAQETLGQNGSFIDVPKVFLVAMRGKYIWAEVLGRYLGWLITALACGVAGGLAIEAKDDLVVSWAIAILVSLSLPVLACLGLILTNPKTPR